MNKLCSLLFCTASGLIFTSCATVFCGSRSKVTFDSNVPVESATLTIDGKKHTQVRFPYTTKVKRGFTDSEVKAETEGYETSRFTIYKTFNAVSVLNLLDLVGWGIDAATGAMMKPDQQSYEIMFVPVKKTETSVESAQ